MEPRFNPLARYQNPPRFPWGLMGVMAVVGTVAVIIGVATAPAAPRTPSNNAQGGGRLRGNRARTGVNERGDNEMVIEAKPKKQQQIPNIR